MLADAVLGAVAAATLAVHAVLATRWSKERERLVDLVVARHAGDVASMRRAEQPRGPKEPKPEPIEQIGI